jgi:hypothetical protein
MKFVFPESVEKELAQQSNQESTESINLSQQTKQQTQLNNEFKSSEPIELTPAQIEARNKQIQNITSKLYTPESPMQPEYRSNSEEIEKRLQRIQQRFQILKEKEEARNAQLQRQAWLRYSHLSKPTMADFKRPLTSFFLFASAIYMTMQYSWYALERENYIENMEIKQSNLINQLNDAFNQQSNIINDFDSKINNKKWWSNFFW